MLLIHKPSNHKLLILVITSICSIGVLLSLSVLTYTPELSHAESITHKKTIEDITYMQEMTPGICQNMESEKQYQLVDKRDDKTYWIAKLKDGNCWMTQNLNLDIPAEGLKAEDTDITEDWNNKSAFKPVATQAGAKPNFTDTTNDIQSWDPAQGGAEKYCVSGKCNNTSATSSNNGHDAQGNYYSWGAATAGQAANLTSSTAGEQSTQSICPKGWRLPLSGSNNNTVSGSFYNLLNGLTVAQVTVSPYYFVYGGVVSSSFLDIAGSNGFYWSSTATGSTNAYSPTFDTGVNPSSNSYRYRGLSVRCAARNELTPDNNVEITVNPTISLDVAGEVEVKKSEANPSTANLDVKVSSNQKYTVGISAANPNLTSTTTSTTIPAKSGLLNTPENGWGIKLKDNTNYTALTTSLQTFYTASGAEIKTVPFTIGISTAPDLPNGEYSTDITITATQN